MNSSFIKNYILIVVFIFSFGFQSCNKEASNPVINIPDKAKSDTYNKCITKGKDNTLEIATWNIEHFPKNRNTSIEVQSIISYSDYDVWGVEEIEDINSLKSIINLDDRYSVLLDTDIISGINRNYHLAYVYRNDKVELLDKQLLSFSSSPFPRKPLMAKFKWKKDGSIFYVINLHLKCCSGSDNEDRRREASRVLKNYIDTELPNDKVIVIGDYNDVIYPYSDSEFQKILDDTQNYKFVDMEIASCEGSECEYSYPSWRPYGSHIDHILITNELFNSFSSVETLTLDKCSNKYDAEVSDHRPVVAFFN